MPALQRPPRRRLHRYGRKDVHIGAGKAPAKGSKDVQKKKARRGPFRFGKLRD